MRPAVASRSAAVMAWRRCRDIGLDQQERGNMEVGGLVGIAVAIVFGIFFARRRPAATRGAKIVQSVVIVAVAAIAAAAGSLGAKYLTHYTGTPSQSDIDQTVRAVLQYPLLGVVVEDYPELKSKLRETVEAEIRNPAKDGPNRMNQFGADVRKRYITPMLLKADDDAARKAANADAVLVVQLQKSDVAACREFGVSGLSRPDQLGRDGAEKFKQSLAAREVAYRSGKASGQTRDQPTTDEIGTLLEASGYTPADFDRLNKIETLTPAEACAATVQLYSAPGKLPPGQGAVLSRYLLAAGG
jgi:hypothetical protein